jgi:integrase
MSARRSYGTGSLKPHVNGDGSESWYGRWYVEDLATGKPKQVRRVVGPKRRAGSTDGLTKRQAEKRMAELMAQTAPVDSADAARTLTWAAETMFSAMHAAEPQTVDTYRRDFENHLREKLGSKPLAKIVREDYEAIVAAMVAGYGRKPKGYSPKTIQNVLRLASRIHNYGRGRSPQWCATNPAEGVELPKVEQGEDVAHLTQGEVSKLLAAIDPDASAWALVDYALWLTATMAGLRQGELIALRRRDLKWLESKIGVRKNQTRKHGERTPKSRASRRDVPLPDALAVVLDRLLKASKFQADDALVFGNPETGEPISPKAMDERLKAAAKAAGIRAISFHGLRHTFGTQCARAGVPMRTLQQWMGHARISTTEIYAAFAEDQAEVAMVENAFASLSHSLPHSEANEPQPTATKGN